VRSPTGLPRPSQRYIDTTSVEVVSRDACPVTGSLNTWEELFPPV
jgi:hypothetical protein